MGKAKKSKSLHSFIMGMIREPLEWRQRQMKRAHVITGTFAGRSWAILSFQLTSFSPHMWLTVEPEAGLEAGPITETTPLGKIWHTERRRIKKTHQCERMHTWTLLDWRGSWSRTRGRATTIQNIQLKRSHLIYKSAAVTFKTLKNKYGGLARHKCFSFHLFI